MGIAAHKNKNEPPCKFCKNVMDRIKAGEYKRPNNDEVRAANREATRLRKEAQRQRERDERLERKRKEAKELGIELYPNGMIKAACGTSAGYRKHKRDGENACPDCMRASRDASREARKNLPRNPQKPAECGTAGGYRRHLKAGEEVCAPCRTAMQDYNNLAKAIRRIKGGLDKLKISARKAAIMPQVALDQYLTAFVEQGLEDTENYKILWAEHESRTKDRQEEMTAKEYAANEH